MENSIVIPQNTSDLTFEKVWFLIQETNRKLDEKFQETDRLIRETNKRFGGLGNSWGDFLEGMVRPGLLEYFTKKGIEVHYSFPNVTEYRDKKLFYEIDLLLFNDIYVIAVEIKSKLKNEYIEEHTERIRKLQEQPPKVFNLHGKIILGAIACISAEPQQIEKAIENGFFVLVQKSNIMEAINPPDFQPKEWKI